MSVEARLDCVGGMDSNEGIPMTMEFERLPTIGEIVVIDEKNYYVKVVFHVQEGKPLVRLTEDGFRIY